MTAAKGEHHDVVVHNMSVPEGMVTVAEAARRLGRSIEQVRRYLREGKLEGRRIGQQWFVPERAVSQRPVPVREPTGPCLVDPPPLSPEEAQALIRQIDEGVEAMRRRLGGDLDIDIVALIRQDRDEH